MTAQGSISTAKLTANRANAQRSTGPRSTAGKERSATNATTHGLLSRRTLVADEDAAVLDALRAQLEQELQPVGALEQLLVDHIVACTWRLRRVYAIDAALVEHERHGLQRSRAATERDRLRFGFGDGDDGDDDEDSGPKEQPGDLGLVFRRASDHFERLSRYELAIERSLRRSLTDLRDRQRERFEAIEVEGEQHAVDDEANRS